MITMLEIHEMLESLANERRIFYSEKDFQFSLAFKIKEKFSQMNIRLEVPMENSSKAVKNTEHIDMIVTVAQQILI